MELSNEVVIFCRIGFSNVKANGKVGMVLKYDSLFPQNYDVSYEPAEISVRVSY